MVVNALLVGGPSDIRREQERHLGPEDVCLIDHWTWDQKSGGTLAHRLPKRTQLVVLVRDMMGHQHSQDVVRLAKRQGVPVVYGTRKWSETRPLVLAALARIPREPTVAPPLPPQPEAKPKPEVEAIEPEPIPQPAAPLLAPATDDDRAVIAGLLLTAIERAMSKPAGQPVPTESDVAMDSPMIAKLKALVDERIAEGIAEATAALQSERDALAKQVGEQREVLISARRLIDSALSTSLDAPPKASAKSGKVYKRSAETRARMAAAQRRRHSGAQPKTKVSSKVKKTRRPMSDAGREAIREGQRQRWAKIRKAEGKT